MWILSLAWAAPDLDAPHRTGARAPADAAVVIGIEDYLRLPDVPYARRDAQAFYDFLVYTRGLRPENVRLLTKEVTREAMEREVRALAGSTGPGGTLWVYFAGHGLASPASGQRLLLGDDATADLSSIEARGVPVDAMSAWASSGEGEAVLVIDACYTGAGRGGEELLGGKRAVVPAFVKPAQGLEWSAAAPNEASGPFEAVRHGAFTYFAVGALRGWADGELDGQRDGVVTAAEAHQYVSRALRTAQITDQTPQLAGDASRTLSNGAREPTPELASFLAPSASPGANTDFAALAARAQAADAAQKRAEDELAAERRRLLDRAAAELRAAATADFQALASLLADPGPQGKAVLEQWLARYGQAEVTVGGVTERVQIPEAERVRTALRTGRARATESLPPPDGSVVSLAGKTLSAFSFDLSGQRGVALEKAVGACDIGLGLESECASKLFRTEDGGVTWRTMPTLGPVQHVSTIAISVDGQKVYAWLRDSGLHEFGTRWALSSSQPRLGPCGPAPDAKLKMVIGLGGELLLVDRTLEHEWYFDGQRWASRGTCEGDAAQPRPASWQELAAALWGWMPELSPELQRALRKRSLRPRLAWTRTDGSLRLLAGSQLLSWDGAELTVMGTLPSLTSLIDARAGAGQGPMWIAVDGQGLLRSATGERWAP